MENSAVNAMAAWAATQALIALLVEKGTLTQAEADSLLQQAEQRGARQATEEALGVRLRR